MREEEFNISPRKREILLSAVSSYIDKACPITSGGVQENAFSKLSSATLRNELAALEEMGYLKQLHTSGGRIPTAKAYRYYVNSLMDGTKLDSRTIATIRDKFSTRSAYLKDILHDLADKISDVLELPTFVKMEGLHELVVQAVNIIPLITGQGLLLIQTSAGILNNTFDLPKNISEDNCKDASKFLTNSLCNRKIGDILDHFDEFVKVASSRIQYYEELFMAVTDVLRKFVDGADDVAKSVSTQKLLKSPMYQDYDEAKKFLDIVDNADNIKEIVRSIDENSTNDVVITIGEENTSEDLQSYSIVKANYTLGSGVVTSIGVLGPERMDYPKIAGALKFIVDELKSMDK